MATQTIDINSASAEEIMGAAPQIGEKRARDIVENRPFGSWEDVKELPGFSDEMIENLQEGGVTLGEELGE